MSIVFWFLFGFSCLGEAASALILAYAFLSDPRSNGLSYGALAVVFGVAFFVFYLIGFVGAFNLGKKDDHVWQKVFHLISILFLIPPIATHVVRMSRGRATIQKDIAEVVKRADSETLGRQVQSSPENLAGS